MSSRLAGAVRCPAHVRLRWLAVGYRADLPIGCRTAKTSFEIRIATAARHGACGAMAVLMNGEGNAGERAVSPGAVGSSDGYVLDNGQAGTYEDADTIPLGDVLKVLPSIIDSGRPPSGASWTIDP